MPAVITQRHQLYKSLITANINSCIFELEIISNCSKHYIFCSVPCLITRSNHEIVLVDDVGGVDNDEVVSALTLAAEDQLFLVHVQGQMLCLLQ